MFRLIIISVLISNISAKLDFYLDDFSDNGVGVRLEPVVRTSIDYLSGEPLWVLSLGEGDWIAPKLRLGSAAEARDFFKYVGPMIIESKQRKLDRQEDPDQPTTITQDPDDVPVISDDDIQKNFLKLMNKYALSIRTAPDSYLSAEIYYDSSPSIALYFKGPYTSIMVKLGRKQWHYFIDIKSSLPAWFHEEHDTRDSPIQVPEDIKIKLFHSLFGLLHMMVGHTL